MARFVPTLLVAFLLAATAVAFAVTQVAKQQRSPIVRPHVEKVVGPRAGPCALQLLPASCPGRPARISFGIREAGRITVSIVDEDGDTVRTLLSERRGRGRTRLFWDGRTEEGKLVREGRYRPRVRLHDQHRTIQLPSEIRLDATPPVVRIVSAAPLRISPDRDGRRELVNVRYTVDETNRPALLVRGVRAVEGKPRVKGPAQLRWFGKLDGRAVPAGRYRLTLLVEDAAGNVSSTLVGRIRVRYVEIGPALLRVRTGRPFRVRMNTDAPTVRWRLAGRTGFAPARRLRIRAPEAPGRYRLYVTANGHADSARVVVSPA
ncbi:MAG: FlgD immunoglobulin-like domain containing protein [Gaiellaceae bacterium]